MNRLVISTLAACLALVALALTGPEVQADSHGNGCAGSHDAGCSGVTCHGDMSVTDHGCAGRASRGEGRWFPGRAIVRGTGAVLRGTARAASAPLKAVGRSRFRPSRRFGGCG